MGSFVRCNDMWFVHHTTTEYCYWVLKPGQQYTGFTVETSDCEMEGGLWTITAEEGAVDVGEQCLEFARYCMSGEDEADEGGDGDYEDEDEEEDHDWWWFGSQNPGDGDNEDHNDGDGDHSALTLTVRVRIFEGSDGNNDDDVAP